jgi:nicotinamidase/pyrazinamidase
MPKEALIVVDVQNDFCPGGALAVPEGHAVVPVLNTYAKEFARRGAPVYASRDWHPRVTHHFREFGGIWPVHCVQGTPGAELHRDLALPPNSTIVDKGQDPNEDAYSAFQARMPSGTALETDLRARGVERVYIGGLATDYCVKSTVLDALARGFRATLLVDAARGVNLKPHDSEDAIAEMVRAGGDLVTVEHVG